MNITTEQTAVLEMRHIVAAPRNRVFAAWTTPEEIRLKHEQLPNDDVRQDHEHGWIGTFEKLERYL